MVHFFDAYGFDLGYNQGPPNPMGITTTAIFGVLVVLLRLPLCVHGFPSIVRKSLLCDLVQIAPIFVNYYRHSLCGVILTPLQPRERVSDPQKCSLKQCYGTTFFRQYFAELLETFESKKLFKSTWCTFSMPIALIQAVISAPWVLWGSQESLP